MKTRVCLEDIRFPCPDWHREHASWRSVFTCMIGLVLMLFGSTSCGPEQEARGPVYGAVPPVKGPFLHFAVHPLHNPEKLERDYQPLMDYVNARLNGARLELEASRDYAEYERKFRARSPEFLLPNPWQTLEAIKAGYIVLAMAGEPADFKGVFVVRKDSGIRVPTDLKGRAISYPSPTALAACIMPQYFLHTQGIDVNKDIENRYVGSQESAIMNAYLGKTAAGATWPPPWRAFQKEHPHEAAELQVAWETESLVNNSVMARNDVEAGVREKVAALLTGLHETDEGRVILAGMETARFFPAASADYDAVRAYVSRFEREVRLVESR